MFGETVSFFTSVKTTIGLLFVLAAASIVGTVVPQQTSLDQIRETSSPFFFRLITILDLNNLFQSWWFVLLLIVLVINLLGCLLQRTPGILSEWRGPTRKKSINFKLSDSRPAGEVKAALAGALNPVLGASPRENRSNGILTLSWEKHRANLLGFPFMHLAIVVILLGGLIGQLFGFKGQVVIPEGEVQSDFKLIPSGAIRSLPFKIAVDRFTLTRYPTGQPKEFRSDVRLLEDGRVAVKGAILVNHPLTFRRISLYQADYRLLGVKEVKLGVVGPDGKMEEVGVEPETSAELPGTDLKIRLLSVDPGTTEQGAGAGISLERAGEKPSAIQVFEKKPAPLKQTRGEIRFLGYRPLYATGLQIGYDPGTWVVWTGCSLLIIGFFLTLFTNHRRLRVEIEDRSDGSGITASGGSRRMRREFREEIDEKLRGVLKPSETGER